MSAETRARVLRELVDPAVGLGWNLFRICLGSSDFTGRPYYSYDDVPSGETDVALARFSMQKDLDYQIVDVLREVQQINPQVLFFASPWSPPGWMKDSGTMCGGRLLPEYFEVAARYYARAILGYRELGIPIYAMTLQNEPLMVHRRYPTCYMSWEDQNRLLKLLKAEWVRLGLDTRLWIFDHNFNEAMTYPARILQDPESYAALDGVAFHSYEGRVEQMGELHAAYPEVNLYFTERSTFGVHGIDEILQYFRHGAKSYNAWVTCLDDRQQPNAGPHPCSPTFLTVSRSDPDDVRQIAEYHLLGQLSKFVQRGAHLIESDYGSTRTVTNAAFANPDGTLVTVVVNQTRREQRFALVHPRGCARASLPGKTVATYLWPSPAGCAAYA
jgi:glucosylceramidase